MGETKLLRRQQRKWEPPLPWYLRAAAERLEPQLARGTADVQNIGSTETMKLPVGTR